MSISTWQAEVAVDCRCMLGAGCWVLGEGPQWQASSELLYWCNILEQRLYWLSPRYGREWLLSA